MKEIESLINKYNSAYTILIDDKNPKYFTEFLLNSSDVVSELSERADALDHIACFWRAVFPSGSRPVMTYDELNALLSDFKMNLEFA